MSSMTSQKKHKSTPGEEKRDFIKTENFCGVHN